MTPVLLKDLLARVGQPGGAYLSWQYAERYLGGGTRSYSRFAADLEISTEYHPQHGAARFDVPTFWVPPDRGHYLVGGIASALPERYRSGAAFLLPVHPETLTVPAIRAALAGCPPGPPIAAVPSANARTVFVVGFDGGPAEPHFLKLHYPKRLSRFTRRLRRQVIELQLWVADELWRIGTPFLPEVAGGVLGHDPVEAWGFLLREAAVRGEPSRPGTVPPGTVPPEPVPPVTVPLFALYGQDVRAPADPTLLEQLIDHSGEPAEQWLTSRLVEPLVRLFLDTLLRTGCALELHGQNTLLCLDADLRATRLAYRDCAIYVDPAIRAERGLTGPLPPRNVISQDIREPRERVLSLVYDGFLGHHTLDFIARLAADRLGVDPAALHRAASRVFHDHAGDRRLLPATVYYYADRLYAGGEWHLVDTGARPAWR